MHVVGMPCSEYDIESDLLFAQVKITDHEEEEGRRIQDVVQMCQGCQYTGQQYQY